MVAFANNGANIYLFQFKQIFFVLFFQGKNSLILSKCI